MLDRSEDEIFKNCYQTYVIEQFIFYRYTLGQHWWKIASKKKVIINMMTACPAKIHTYEWLRGARYEEWMGMAKPLPQQHISLVTFPPKLYFERFHYQRLALSKMSRGPGRVLAQPSAGPVSDDCCMRPVRVLYAACEGDVCGLWGWCMRPVRVMYGSLT